MANSSTKDKPKHPGGRPTKYKPEYCQLIIDWMDEKPYEEKEGKKTPNPLPTFQEFAHSIGVHTDTLQEWKKVHTEFSVSYKKAQQLQEYFWMTNSLLGLYPPAFACFAGKNMFGWRDKQEHEHTGDIKLTVTKDDTKCL